MRLYITHCTYVKDESLKGTKIKVTPDKLYIGEKIQRFIRRCKHCGVLWAIFSDQYGIWFSNIENEYYEKHPNEVTSEEFEWLIKDSEEKLKEFDEIYFYANYKSRYFHSLYRKLIQELKRKGLNITLISHLIDIKKG